MFDPVFDSMKKATEVTLKMQQELFKKWAAIWPVPGAVQAPWGEQPQKFAKKWAETAAELVKKQGELLEAQQKAALRNIEESFRLAEAKDFEELRAQTLELWRKSFDSLREAFEAQARELQAATNRWVELVTKGAA